MEIKEWIFKNKRFHMETIDIPDKLKTGDVLIKPSLVGICGSDLFAMELVQDTKTLRLGHEWVGEVLDPNGTTFKKGQKVTSPAILGCGKCDFCNRGDSHLCTNCLVLGGEELGLLRNILIIHERHLIETPDLNHSSAVLIEVAAVSFEALRQIKYLGYDKSHQLLIFGAGPVGLFCALQAKQEGYKYKIIEVDKFRVQFARSLGLDVEQTQSAVMNRDYSKKFSFIVDCSGDGNNRSGFWKYFNFFTSVGVKVLIVGKYLNNPTINSNLFAKKDSTIKWMRGMSIDILKDTYDFWKEDIEKLSDKIITHRFRFNEVAEAFDVAMKRKDSIKVVIDFSID
ncbi:MAG: alcohol dehydrogenase catalytic domain-containing protein [Bacteriovoracaceae bacterium]|nr:alcohol dehydrogenase catalytic domain-containing protein [Bacteriovoracaceae bacterium]